MAAADYSAVDVKPFGILSEYEKGGVLQPFPMDDKQSETTQKVDSQACRIFKAALFCSFVGLGVYFSPIAFTATFLAASALSLYYFAGLAKKSADSIFEHAEWNLSHRKKAIQTYENAERKAFKPIDRKDSYIENQIKKMRSVDTNDVLMSFVGSILAFDLLCVMSGILPGLAAGKIAAYNYYAGKAEKACAPILAELKQPVV